MNSHWIPTNQYYEQLINEPDEQKRHVLYYNLLVEPWQTMMSMMSNTQDDPLAGAKAWNWLLPNQIEQMASLLQTLEEAQAWQIGEKALQTAVASFEPHTNQIPINTVTGWLVLADPANMQSFERGYTGATDWMQPRLIGQFWEPNEYNLLRLEGLVAHEMHHLIRFRVSNWNMQTATVADYIVLEGMAESFATALFGEKVLGYYVAEFAQDDLQQAYDLIAQGLYQTGFNLVRSYIFGDALAEQSGFEALGGMPTYGGYAIGYHLVQAFLKESGLSIQEATFLSTQQIIEGSKFFPNFQTVSVA